MTGGQLQKIRYMTLIGVHELYRQMHHNQGHVTTLYIHLHVYRHTYSGAQNITTILVYYTYIYMYMCTLQDSVVLHVCKQYFRVQVHIQYSVTCIKRPPTGRPNVVF